MEACDVSVIIPVFNDQARLDKCLSDLRHQRARPREIIVVDNGSDVPVTVPDGVMLIREPQPGSYRARNAGILASTGSILAFTDSDCLPDDRWIERGAAAIDFMHGWIGGKIALYPVDNRRPTSTELYEMALVMKQEDFIRERGFALTANMWTTRATFDAVGLFRPNMLSGGDAEWCNRVLDHGFSGRYEEGLIVAHPARHSLGDVYRKMRRIQSGRAQLTGERHGSRSVRAKLARFARSTRKWPLTYRARVLFVAAVAELTPFLSSVDLRLRKRQRL